MTAEPRLRRARVVLGRIRPRSVRSYYLRTYGAAPFRHRPLTLLPAGRHRPARRGERRPEVVHIANFGPNAGDILLPVMLRDLFTALAGPIAWRARHVHVEVDADAVTQLNRSAGVIIGGGGLFLADTNPNDLSGWQWPCATGDLERITAPLALFAVGYNQFRGQGDLGPLFRRNLEALARKAVFLGLRNTGSIDAVRALLPDELHAAVRFQPCMTTLAGLLYPDLVGAPRGPAPVIAFNGAFDRPDLRFGDRRHEILGGVAEAAARLARQGAQIAVVLHQEADGQLLPYIEAAGVRPRVVRLARRSPAEIVRAWSRVTVAVGMRGHAQMVPFGCGRPIVSLVSHDKLWYFLDDVGARDWGVELRDPDVPDRIEAAVTAHLADLRASEHRIADARRQLWKVSVDNVLELWDALDRSGPRSADQPGGAARGQHLDTGPAQHAT